MSSLTQLILMLFFGAFALFFFYVLQTLLAQFQRLKQAGIASQGGAYKQAMATFSQPGQGRMLSILGGVFGLLAGMLFSLGWAVAFAAAVAGALLPYLLLRRHHQKRLKQLESQLVLSLTLVGNSMRAGRTLPQAIEDASENVPKPMAEEFSLITRQIRVGVEPERALEMLSERVDNSDVLLAVRAMCVSIRTGVSLPESIKQICETISSRARVEGKLNVLTSQGRLQGIVVGLIPFVLMGGFYLSSPKYVRVLFDTFAGNVVLVIIVVLQLIAYFMIQKICQVKV